MLIKVIAALLCGLVFCLPASAQTIGPTPTDYPPDYTPEGTPPPTDAGWTPSPTPGPSPTPVPYVFTAAPTRTPIPIDASGLYESLIEANEMLGQAQLNQPVMPMANIQPIFSYAKWLLSPSSADELFGPFAPIIVHAGIFVAMVIGLSVVYGIVYAAVYLIKFVVWIFKLILLVIDVVVSVVGSIFRFFF